MIAEVNNIGIIAKKDFSDLVTNHGMLIVLLVYLLAMVVSIVNVHDHVSTGMSSYDFVNRLLGSLVYVLTVYGGIFAVLIGFWSISSDTMSHSINTLLMKPVYRDTVINGKLLGSTLFLLCMFILTTFLYISLLFLIFGSRVEAIFPMFMGRVPVALLMSLIVATTFLCLSMLVSTLLGGKSVALLVNVLIFVILNIITTVGIGGNLASLFGDNIVIGDNVGDTNRQIVAHAVASLSPEWNLGVLVDYGLLDPAMSVMSVLSSHAAEVFKLLLGLLVLLILNYVAFLRRDVA